MQRYLLRRLTTAVPTLFGITILIFIAMRVLPGDPIAQIAWRSCYRSAVGDAVRKVNSPLLIAVHTGKPVAMTAMAAK